MAAAFKRAADRPSARQPTSAMAGVAGTLHGSGVGHLGLRPARQGAPALYGLQVRDRQVCVASVERFRRGDEKRRTGSVDVKVVSEEADLLQAIANGDAGAFRTLTDLHLPRVLATARRLLGDASEAEDVSQEAFLRLWRDAANLQVGAYGVSPWLSRVAANLAIDRLRARKRLEVCDELPEMPVAADQLAILREQDLSGRVLEAMDALPDRQRVALTLFHFEERSQREVAETLAITEEALESLLARGRRKLRALLAEDWQAMLETDTSVS